MTDAEIKAAFGQIRKLAADHGVWRLAGSTWDHADRLEAHIEALQKGLSELRAAAADVLAESGSIGEHSVENATVGCSLCDALVTLNNRLAGATGTGGNADGD